MTDRTTTMISVDQFIAAPLAKVWRALTEPELLARWWAAGDIAATVGHRFHLEMPGWGAVPCEVVEVEPERRFVYTFTENWTLVWRLVPEGCRHPPVPRSFRLRSRRQAQPRRVRADGSGLARHRAAPSRRRGRGHRTHDLPDHRVSGAARVPWSSGRP